MHLYGSLYWSCFNLNDASLIKSIIAWSFSLELNPFKSKSVKFKEILVKLNFETVTANENFAKNLMTICNHQRINAIQKYENSSKMIVLDWRKIESQ